MITRSRHVIFSVRGQWPPSEQASSLSFYSLRSRPTLHALRFHPWWAVAGTKAGSQCPGLTTGGGAHSWIPTTPPLCLPGPRLSPPTRLCAVGSSHVPCEPGEKEVQADSLWQALTVRWWLLQAEVSRWPGTHSCNCRPA